MKIKLHNPTIPNGLLEALSNRRLEYSTPETLFNLVWIDGEHYCGVFGDGDNAAYEWFDWRNGQLSTSDCGYGNDSVALRDALAKAVQYPSLPIANQSANKRIGSQYFKTNDEPDSSDAVTHGENCGCKSFDDCPAR